MEAHFIHIKKLCFDIKSRNYETKCWKYEIKSHKCGIKSYNYDMKSRDKVKILTKTIMTKSQNWDKSNNWHKKKFWLFLWLYISYDLVSYNFDCSLIIMTWYCKTSTFYLLVSHNFLLFMSQLRFTKAWLFSYVAEIPTASHTRF